MRPRTGSNRPVEPAPASHSIKWAKLPFERCIEYIHQVDRVLHLCMQGLSHVSTLPALAKALVELDKADGAVPFSPEQQRHLDETNTRAQFAKAEIDDGFPILHSHTVIALWGALEALVSDLAIAWLENEPSTLQNDEFARLKIPLAEYERLSKCDRMAFLVKELARSLNADFKLGIGKFEVLLEALGLSGAVDDNVRRTLFEMSQVRNVLVHRAGIVDGRFKEACPWVAVEVGEKLRVDHKTYVRYVDATHEYVLCLINRVRVRFGIGPYEPTKKDNSSDSGAA